MFKIKLIHNITPDNRVTNPLILNSFANLNITPLHFHGIVFTEMSYNSTIYPYMQYNIRPL